MSIDDALVEKAAQALYEHGSAGAWSGMQPEVQESFRRHAHAVLAAVLPDVTRAPAVDADDGQANDCRHDSATGVDTAPVGPDKVWACDHCGMRWRQDRLVAGDRELLAAIIRERHYLGDTPGEIADALLASGVLRECRCSRDD